MKRFRPSRAALSFTSNSAESAARRSDRPNGWFGETLAFTFGTIGAKALLHHFPVVTGVNQRRITQMSKTTEIHK